MGRPSTCTPEVVESICERLANGEPLRAICRDEGMPHWSTVYNWMDADEEVFLRIARAREAGHDAIAEQCLDIADDSACDIEETDTGTRVNSEVVQRSKLRVETRLKLLAKWSPKKYGDKVQQEISGPNGGPVQSVIDVSGLSTAALQELVKAKDEADQS